MSTVKRSIIAEAADRSGMTLDELITWAQEAKTSGVPGGTVVSATVKIGGKLKRLEVRG